MPKSEWKVCSQPFGYCGDNMYQVYRLIDDSRQDVEDNREFALPSWVFSQATANIECKRLNKEAKFPKYVKSADGYIGAFRRLDKGDFPVYYFPGGERIADNWEIESGSNDMEDLI